MFQVKLKSDVRKRSFINDIRQMFLQVKKLSEQKQFLTFTKFFCKRDLRTDNNNILINS